MPTEKPTREQIEEARDRVRALLTCFTQEPDIAQYVDGTEAMALQLLLDVTAPPPREIADVIQAEEAAKAAEWAGDK